MRSPSSSSVRVFSIDRDAIVARLRAAAGRLVEEDSSVLRVLLFGSLARGNYGPGSDADVGVILRDSAQSVWFKRIPEFMPRFADLGVPVDVFAYTLDELEQARNNPFFDELLRGEVIAERKGTA